ncbi:MAG TPA: chloride channel protein [Gammaproteobacteria bacterium]|nr:chloride channel protein [Gammaproteobacteria bacterium]
MRTASDEDAGLRLALLAVLVGIIAGGGAVIFRSMIGLFHNLFLTGTLSWHYDANVHTPAGPLGPWIILVPVGAALVVAFLVKNFAPEAKGHGVPEVMDAIYYNRGVIRPIVALIKSLASAISIGSGGSVGREGPMIQIGSSFGSTVGQWIRMPDWQRITLVGCGAAGGLSATFNTPLAGLLFAIELIVPETSARTLIPIAIATGSATFISRLAFGNNPSFHVPQLVVPPEEVFSPGLLLVYLFFGLALGLVAWLYIRAIYWCEDLFDGMPGNYYTRHALGMLLVGVMMYLFMRHFGHYYVEGVGYATVQQALEGVLTDPYLLVLIFLGKLAATSLTLGSGASGGIFSPSLYLGAALGSLYSLAVNAVAPGLHIATVNLAIVGMAGVVGGATGAVLTAIVMTFEMTRDYHVIIPLILTVSMAYGIRRMLLRDSIYTFKLTRRRHYIPDSLHTNLYMMRRTLDVLDTPVHQIEADQPLSSLRTAMRSRRRIPHLIVTREGTLRGILSAERHAALLVNPGGDTERAVESFAAREYTVVRQNDLIFDVVAKLRAAGNDIAVVTADGTLDRPEDVLGIITLGDIARNSNFLRQMQRQRS